MQIQALADEYGVSEADMRDACATLGVTIADDGELDEALFRSEVAKRRAARTPAAPAAPSEPPVALPETVAPRRILRTTPALLAGVALVAAFFMPLVSGFGGVLTLSTWSYLRLVADFHEDLKFGDWAVVTVLVIAVLLAVVTVITEALGKRNRILLIATALAPIGLVVYIAIEVGSLDDFRHADIAGYLGIAAALVLLCTALGALDRGPTEFRGTLYALCGLLVIAGIAIPATGSSVQDDLGQIAKGFEDSMDDFATPSDGVIDTTELEYTIIGQLRTEHDFVATTVDCPEDVAAEVDATTTCTFEVFNEEGQYEVIVTVKSVDGEDYELELDPSDVAV